VSAWAKNRRLVSELRQVKRDWTAPISWSGPPSEDRPFAELGDAARDYERDSQDDRRPNATNIRVPSGGIMEN
jgi:hypothetical protein